MAEVVAESMVGGTTFHREVISVRFPEPWSSTSLAKTRCSKTPREKFVLDRAFALIEGHIILNGSCPEDPGKWTVGPDFPPTAQDITVN